MSHVPGQGQLPGVNVTVSGGAVKVSQVVIWRDASFAQVRLETRNDTDTSLEQVRVRAHAQTMAQSYEHKHTHKGGVHAPTHSPTHRHTHAHLRLGMRVHFINICRTWPQTRGNTHRDAQCDYCDV